MKRPPQLQIVATHVPTDEQLLRCWDSGMNTNEIARQFSYPEYNVESRLWRLREARRAKWF